MTNYKQKQIQPEKNNDKKKTQLPSLNLEQLDNIAGGFIVLIED